MTETTPSFTARRSAGTPSFPAARSRSKRRASAAAYRRVSAPFWMPVDPEAPPWLHVKAVSPITTFTRSNFTSSSSATIWPMATSTPWPMSILPKNAVTLPSGRMAIQESSSSGSNGGLPSPTPLVWARAMGTVPGIITLTTRAPLAFRKSRREVWVRSIGRPLRHRSGGGALDRAQDRHVRSAAALEPDQRVADLTVARLRLVAEQRGGGHHPARQTIAALRDLLGDERLLERMGPVRRAEAGDGRDLLALNGTDRCDARARGLPIDVHGAGAALGQAAAELRIGHPQVVAQGVEQWHGRVSVDLGGLAIDHEPDPLAHAGSFIGESASGLLNRIRVHEPRVKPELGAGFWAARPRGVLPCRPFSRGGPAWADSRSSPSTHQR